MTETTTERAVRRLRGQTKDNLITYAIALGMFAVAQIFSATGSMSSLFQGLLIPLCVYAIMAVSLNLTVGILGELSLGHAGFMCVGAYAGSIFSMLTKTALPSVWVRFPLALLIGALAAALFGLIIGIPVLRLSGDYLAIVTLAFGEIIKNLVNNLYIATDANGIHVSVSSVSSMQLDGATQKVILNGPMGITGTPNDSTFIVAFILLLFTLCIVMNLKDSRAGRAIMAIRDNRIAAESVGINIAKYKLIAIVISAFFAGIAGVLYSHNLATLNATTKNFGYNMSIMILVYVVLGGMGSIRGSMIAAVLLTILPEWLRFLADYRMLIYAVVLIFMMLFNSAPVFVRLREQMGQHTRKWLAPFLLKFRKKAAAKGENE